MSTKTTGTKASSFVAKSKQSSPINGGKNLGPAGPSMSSSSQIASVAGTINSNLKGPNAGGLG